MQLIKKRKNSVLILVMVCCMLISAKEKETDEHIPYLTFKSNSIAFDSIQDLGYGDSGMDSTRIVNKIIYIINTEHVLGVKIVGCYDSKEKDTNIGVERAEKVKKILVERGISDSILTIMSMEGKCSYSTKKIDEMKDEKDKEYWRSQNRVVFFNIHFNNHR